MENNIPIAVKTLNNVSGLAIYKLTDENVLIGFNNEKPQLKTIKYDKNEKAYVNYYGKQYLSDFVKVGM